MLSFQNYQQLKYYSFCDCLYKYKNKTIFTFPLCFKTIISCAINEKINTLAMLLFFHLFFYVIFFQQPKLHFIRKHQRLHSLKRKHKVTPFLAFLYFSCTLYKNKLLSFLHYLSLIDLTILPFSLHLKALEKFSLSIWYGSFSVPISYFLFEKKIKNIEILSFYHIFYLKFLFKINFLNKVKISKINRYFLIQNSLYFNLFPIR